MRALKVVGATVGILAIGLACFFIARSLMPGPPRFSARETLLMAQNEELTKLADGAEKGTLLDFKNVMIVVDQELVQDLLRAVTPMQADVGKGFHLEITAADAAFGDGVALVRLTGSASLGGTTMGSEVTVFGAIDVVRLDPVSGILQCSITVLGVEAQNAAALGRGDPVGRLTEALTHGGLGLLLGGLEIPVSVENNLSIPAVESKRLQIKAENLPLTVAAEQIKVFAGKLWVFVDVALAPRAVAAQKPGAQPSPTPSAAVAPTQVKG
ncbi:MAG: hypothetical protein ABIR28_13995 [Vicinamibacteria bacterium]